MHGNHFYKASCFVRGFKDMYNICTLYINLTKDVGIDRRFT